MVAQAGGDVEALKDVAVDKVAGKRLRWKPTWLSRRRWRGRRCAAAAEGASVILVEKGAAYGGNTIYPVGIFRRRSGLSGVCPLTEGQKSEIERYIALNSSDERMAGWQAAVKEQQSLLTRAMSTYSIRNYMIRPMTAGIIWAIALDRDDGVQGR